MGRVSLIVDGQGPATSGSSWASPLGIEKSASPETGRTITIDKLILWHLRTGQDFV